MSVHHSTRSCSPLKTVLGKIGDRYPAYYTTYKMYAMATCHGGTAIPRTEALISLQRTKNMQISAMKACTPQMPHLP